MKNSVKHEHEHAHVQKHPFHLVDPSPWPLVGATGAFLTTLGGVMYMHNYEFGGYMLSMGLIMLLYTMAVWWRDVIREGTFEGRHTQTVQLGLRYGMILFIVSECMFFFAFFWAYFASSLAPTIEIGSIWPPKGIAVFNPWEVPFLNTLILLLSGAAVTWAHHSIIAGNKRDAIISLFITILLAVTFTGFQVMEYTDSAFTIADGVYGCLLYTSDAADE